MRGETQSFEIIPTGTSSTALTYALMKEKKRNRRKRRKVRKPKTPTVPENRELVDRSEWETREKIDSPDERTVEEDVEPVTPKRSNVKSEAPSPESSPSHVSTSNSEDSVSSLDNFCKEPKSGKGPGFLRRVFTKMSPRRPSSGRPSNTVMQKDSSGNKKKNNTTEDILQDLEFNSRTTTPPLRNTDQRNSRRAMLKVMRNPGAVMKKATRYRDRAKKLLESIAMEEETQRKNMGRSRSSVSAQAAELETSAKKAFEYASEARRLIDLVHHTSLVAKEVEEDVLAHKEGVEVRAIQGPTPSEISGISEPSYADFTQRHHDRFGEASDSISIKTESTSFSENLEREYYQKKLAELELFSSQDVQPPIKCTRGDLGDFYTTEAKRLVSSFDEGDEVSVMSPLSTDTSVMTTRSEIEAREEHKKKMEELELFSSGNIASNIWYALTGSFIPQPTIPEEKAESKAAKNEGSPNRKNENMKSRGMEESRSSPQRGRSEVDWVSKGEEVIFQKAHSSPARYNQEEASVDSWCTEDEREEAGDYYTEDNESFSDDDDDDESDNSRNTGMYSAPLRSRSMSDYGSEGSEYDDYTDEYDDERTSYDDESTDYSQGISTAYSGDASEASDGPRGSIFGWLTM